MSVPTLLKEIITNLPESPGIYKFLDEKGQLLYIGKSKNLKKRVTSYFGKQGKDTHKRTLRLIFHIHQIEIIQTGTELEALILEDDLIKQYLPLYNIKQKKFKEQVYIIITSDDFPVIKIINNEDMELFDHLFGPFKDKYAAEYLISIINKVLCLRSCTDTIPINKCMLFGIDKCMGPCQKNISVSEYNRVVQIAIEFLKGNHEPISNTIAKQIEKTAEKLSFEEAAVLRDIEDFCINFCKRQEFITKFIKQNCIFFSRNRTFLFRHGNLLKIYKQNVSIEQIKKYFQNNNLQSIKINNVHHLIDRAYVVWVWMKQNGVKYEFID